MPAHGRGRVGGLGGMTPERFPAAVEERWTCPSGLSRASGATDLKPVEY